MVLGVVLAAALVGVSLPALEVADRTGAATRTEATATDLAATVERFAATNDPVRAGEPGARRVVTIHLPAGASLRIGTRLRWRAGGQRGDARLAPAIETPGDGVLTLAGGTHRLRLGYVRRPAGPVVTVRRFKPEAGTTPTRVPERWRRGRRVRV
ncbi:hypothetical protein N0B31_01415 [Salinirubellus salinus]|uniref:DUF7311 domain-containing protein n=1 Tax=Salinirubellus salinus TaxID=1364945 RepID=A0A9E7UBQ1_9EURY|nr:hypothetical protein [Salinirubellus salinus]UWM54949.1 hypothetical protein N0B31_01415 [Salinirubellus salinus]